MKKLPLRTSPNQKYRLVHPSTTDTRGAPATKPQLAYVRILTLPHPVICQRRSKHKTTHERERGAIHNTRRRLWKKKMADGDGGGARTDGVASPSGLAAAARVGAQSGGGGGGGGEEVVDLSSPLTTEEGAASLHATPAAAGGLRRREAHRTGRGDTTAAPSTSGRGETDRVRTHTPHAARVDTVFMRPLPPFPPLLRDYFFFFTAPDATKEKKPHTPSPKLSHD